MPTLWDIYSETTSLIIFPLRLSFVDIDMPNDKVILGGGSYEAYYNATIAMEVHGFDQPATSLPQTSHPSARVRQNPIPESPNTPGLNQLGFFLYIPQSPLFKAFVVVHNTSKENPPPQTSFIHHWANLQDIFGLCAGA